MTSTSVCVRPNRLACDLDAIPLVGEVLEDVLRCSNQKANTQSFNYSNQSPYPVVHTDVGCAAQNTRRDVFSAWDPF